MVTSPLGGQKRRNSGSSDGERPRKRLEPSSPEEGELDDSSTPPPSAAPIPSEVPQGKIRVPFPFKKKPASQIVPSTSILMGEAKPPPSSGYERSTESGKKIRENGGGNENHSKSRMDHWEPSMGGSHRDYSRQPRPNRHPSDYPVVHPRSPLSPTLSHRGDRLIDRLDMSTESNYGSRRRDDRDWDRPSHDRRGDYYDRRDYDSGRDRSYYGDRDDRHYSRDRRSDRFYRPDEDYRRASSREWPRRDDTSDPGVREDGWGHGNERRKMDRYMPLSPASSSKGSRPHLDYEDEARTPAGRPPVSKSPAYRPQSPTEPSRDDRPLRLDGPPPPPAMSPPPPPPPDERLIKERDQLPPHQNSYYVPPKRPHAPNEGHVPPSMSLPHKPVDSEPQRKSAEIPKKPVRKVLAPRRSRKEEELAYGRVFQGCGLQSDYDVTTKLGEGTFGEVHKAVQKSTGRLVALKRILMHNEKEGMPVTALREIKILKALKHPCIIEILDMFVVRSNENEPLTVYMVFPYMDHDLAGLLDNERVKLQPSQIKLYMKQLLEGTEYMHRNNILHRDMKAANLLISNTGSLRIADFGLARAYDSKPADHRGRERKYTNCVVTRWYRPPELLLGARQYGGEVDIWGIGCVLGEMFNRRPILPGTSDIDQLEKIWQLCGTPTQHSWPNYDTLPGCEGLPRFTQSLPRTIKMKFVSVEPETVDLLDKLLTCNPKERITAAQALDHEYFWTDPLPADPKSLPTYEASHEFDRRGQRAPVHRPVVQPLPPAPPRPPYYGNGPPPGRYGGPPPGGPPFGSYGGPPSQYPPSAGPPRGGYPGGGRGINNFRGSRPSNSRPFHPRGGPPGGNRGGGPPPPRNWRNGPSSGLSLNYPP